MIGAVAGATSARIFITGAVPVNPSLEQAFESWSLSHAGGVRVIETRVESKPICSHFQTLRR